MKYNKKFLFRVEVDGIVRAAFMTCSPIKATVNDVEVWEGGALLAHKEPGRVVIDDITLTRGVTGDVDMYNLWLKTLTSDVGVEGVGNVGSGEEDDVEYDIAIIELGRDQRERQRWEVKVAHTKGFENDGWDNNTDSAQVEKLVMRVKSFKLIKAAA